MSGHGYFGEYGGRFAAETLMAPLQELERSWKEIGESQSFKDELNDLLENYAGRPTPLYRCARLSDKLDMDLWLKREDLLHTGAHKLNNSLGQTLLAKKMGKTHIIAETGAGQHGVATATASALLGLGCTVYMGAIDAARQRPNVERMKLLGAKIELVHSGQKTLKDAVNEALRTWVGQPEESHYILGSALGPHPFPSMVAHFQKIIGEEARAQMLKATGELPDWAVACVGGGSNAIGLFRAFVEDSSVKLIGVEAGGRSLEPGSHAARFEGGKPGVLHGTYTWMLQDEHGQVLPTHSVSAGLDYPAVGPEHAWLRDEGRAAYYSAGDDSALLAFDMLAQYEGILPALESSHALGWVLEEKEKLRGQKILINLSGRGDKDLDHVLEIKGLS